MIPSVLIEGVINGLVKNKTIDIEFIRLMVTQVNHVDPSFTDAVIKDLYARRVIKKQFVSEGNAYDIIEGILEHPGLKTIPNWGVTDMGLVDNVIYSLIRLENGELLEET